MTADEISPDGSQPTTTVVVEADLEQHLVRSTTIGPWTRIDEDRNVQLIDDAMTQTGLRLLLLDYTRLDLPETLTKMFLFSEDTYDWALRRLDKVAVVADLSDAAVADAFDFWVTAFANHGVPIRLFGHVDAAEAWLQR